MYGNCIRLGGLCYNKLYLVFVPDSRHRAPKTLDIFWVIEASFVTHEKKKKTQQQHPLLNHIWVYVSKATVGGPWVSREGLNTTERSSTWLKDWRIAAQGAGERGVGEVLHDPVQSQMASDWISRAYWSSPDKKLLKEELLGASSFVSTFMCWEGGAPSKDTEAKCPHPLLYSIGINPVRLFLSCVLSKKAFSVGLFLSFMSHFVSVQNWGGAGEL